MKRDGGPTAPQGVWSVPNLDRSKELIGDRNRTSTFTWDIRPIYTRYIHKVYIYLEKQVDQHFRGDDSIIDCFGCASLIFLTVDVYSFCGICFFGAGAGPENSGDAEP